MKVRIKRTGFLKVPGGKDSEFRRYREGEIVELQPYTGFKKDPKTDKLEKINISAKDQFSEKWMEEVEEVQAKVMRPKGKRSEAEDVI